MASESMAAAWVKESLDAAGEAGRPGPGHANFREIAARLAGQDKRGKKEE